MLASKYTEEDVTNIQWRVLHRIGARDPAGIKRAMKRYKVDNMADLVAVLEHHKPKAKPLERLKLALGRVAGGYNYDPHKHEMKRAFKYEFDNKEFIIIKERIQKVKNIYDG